MASKPPSKAVPSQVRVIFGENLRAARQEAGLTQEQLAEAAGLSRPHLSDIERGLHNVQLEQAEGLASAVGKDLLELLKRPRRTQTRKKS